MFEEAERRQQWVTVVEWPGFESNPAAIPKVKTSAKIVKAINAGRTSVPLDVQRPPPAMMALPWLTLVDLVDEVRGKKLDFMLTGPAQHRAGRWQLPVMGDLDDVAETLKLQQEERETLAVLPRS